MSHIKKCTVQNAIHYTWNEYTYKNVISLDKWVYKQFLRSKIRLLGAVRIHTWWTNSLTRSKESSQDNRSSSFPFPSRTTWRSTFPLKPRSYFVLAPIVRATHEQKSLICPWGRREKAIDTGENREFLVVLTRHSRIIYRITPFSGGGD